MAQLYRTESFQFPCFESGEDQTCKEKGLKVKPNQELTQLRRVDHVIELAAFLGVRREELDLVAILGRDRVVASREDA